ncbi:hypothetical protein PR048_032970, partial [Dryococelus australis]
MLLKGTGKTHCFPTSSSEDFEDLHIGIFVENFSFDIKGGDYVICIYKSRWWLAEVTKGDCDVHFFHPPGPSTSFVKSKNDTLCVLLASILNVLSVSEFWTSTARIRNTDPEMRTRLSTLLSIQLQKTKKNNK